MSNTSPSQGTHAPPGPAISGPTNIDAGQTTPTYTGQHAWPGYPTQFIAMPMGTLPGAPQSSVSAHGQPPPPYAPNSAASASVNGLVSSTSSSGSNGSPHGPVQQQHSIPQQQQTAPALPPHVPMPAHSSMTTLTAAMSHQMLPKLATSFSQPTVPSGRDNAMHAQQQRRESLSFGRPAANNGTLRHSPSVVRINRPSQPTASSSADDFHKFNAQHAHPPRPNPPQLQLGYSRPNNEGHSQMHWMTNHPHQQQ